MKGFSHGGYTRRVCSPLKETNLGMGMAFLTPKGNLFNNHLPELDEKFGALLV